MIPFEYISNVGQVASIMTTNGCIANPCFICVTRSFGSEGLVDETANAICGTATAKGGSVVKGHGSVVVPLASKNGKVSNEVTPPNGLLIVYCKAVTTLPPPHPSWLVSQESNCWGLTLSSQVLLIHSRRKTSEKDTQYNECREEMNDTKQRYTHKFESMAAEPSNAPATENAQHPPH